MLSFCFRWGLCGGFQAETFAKPVTDGASAARRHFEKSVMLCLISNLATSCRRSILGFRLPFAVCIVSQNKKDTRQRAADSTHVQQGELTPYIFYLGSLYFSDLRAGQPECLGLSAFGFAAVFLVKPTPAASKMLAGCPILLRFFPCRRGFFLKNLKKPSRKPNIGTPRRPFRSEPVPVFEHDAQADGFLFAVVVDQTFAITVKALDETFEFAGNGEDIVQLQGAFVVSGVVAY